MATATSFLEICEQDQIDQAAPMGREFFSRVLGIDWDQCLVTDESALSDFSFSGMPAERIPAQGTLAQHYAVWDAWVLAKIQEEFGATIPRTGLRLLAVFELIEQHRRQALH